MLINMNKIVLILITFILSLGFMCKQDKNNIKPGSENKTPGSSEIHDFKKYFDEYGVKGSFVMYDLNNDKYHYYDSARCTIGYSPASTFKIPNSIIGLETGVIPDEYYVIPWDSVKRRDPCDKDLNMIEAMQVSCIYYYQQLASRVGDVKMSEMVKSFGYGNMDISGGIDMFWLTGWLRISQLQQIDFLKKMYKRELPVSDRSISIVEKIMILDVTSEYVLRGKTGWSQSETENNGWLVGWVERGGNVYFYATNAESGLDNKKFGESRRAITEKILRDLGVLP